MQSLFMLYNNQATQTLVRSHPCVRLDLIKFSWLLSNANDSFVRFDGISKCLPE